MTAWREPLGARARRWVRKHARFVAGSGAALFVGLVSLAVATALSTAAERRERLAKEHEEAAKLQERRRPRTEPPATATAAAKPSTI